MQNDFIKIIITTIIKIVIYFFTFERIRNSSAICKLLYLVVKIIFIEKKLFYII